METTSLRTGIAFAATTALLYSLYSGMGFGARDSFLSFMNKLFHGMDFSTMVTPQAFTFSGFLIALIVLSIWALGAGMFFFMVAESP